MSLNIQRFNGKFEGVLIHTNKQVPTFDHAGKMNGFLLEIESVRDNFIPQGIQQVYMTVCDPNEKKGLHEHEHKEDNFCCISGKCEIVLYKDGEFMRITMGEGDYKTVKIPAGVAHGIKCIGGRPAYVLNCTHPPYDPENPDQTEVEIKDW